MTEPVGGAGACQFDSQAHREPSRGKHTGHFVRLRITQDTQIPPAARGICLLGGGSCGGSATFVFLLRRAPRSKLDHGGQLDSMPLLSSDGNGSGETNKPSLLNKKEEEEKKKKKKNSSLADGLYQHMAPVVRVPR